MNPPDTDIDSHQRLTRLVTLAAAQDDVTTDVQANHDENRWWPTWITDYRMRMLVAGWSTRISYTMINTYSAVVTRSAHLGFDALKDMPDDEIVRIIQPLGLPAARIGYLRSLTDFLDGRADDYLLDGDATTVIADFATNVAHASYKVAQCSLLYARGYHCGIIPVDSGMITRLAPALGLCLSSGAIAHEQMRLYLETHADTHGDHYRQLIYHQQAIALPARADPAWWLHLMLIYFKRRYLNQPHPRICGQRPFCDQIMDCAHSRAMAMA
ncbi:hypothetical protein [Actinoplanes xinjiangensis]|uniref:Uncharacterized protein n=1 Tax=Actinoplanes xinjiangensis TaxID=512350 RepID=A0A316EB35_9ACTN|nr:hypothetical protein [Actinoplanes xinjiangensis]PWK28034.1 hypothetical protein BC793_1518 [Actinoplanes xinjiangensis]GIF45227.1 hypothetical protein Axi01nite_95380 [Actinoplanes xinjiangensis]